MAQNQYITKVQFDYIFTDLNYETSDETRKVELLDRATGDLEADLARKFVVPLIPQVSGMTYQQMLLQPNMKFAVNKVLNATKAKIRAIIGYEKNRNLTGTIDSTEKFLNVHETEYKECMKGLMDPMIDYGFLLLNQAQDAQTPVQHIALSKADNKIDPYDNGDFGGFF
jgi:hypothetical protein